jgi:hypothetical protein
VIEVSCPDRLEEFARKVDGAWSDLLWPYRASDIVDDQFLRYFHFITELCKWHEGQFAVGDVVSLAERAYGQTNPKSPAHLDFLFRPLTPGCTLTFQRSTLRCSQRSQRRLTQTTPARSCFTVPSISSDCAVRATEK